MLRPVYLQCPHRAPASSVLRERVFMPMVSGKSCFEMLFPSWHLDLGLCFQTGAAASFNSHLNFFHFLTKSICLATPPLPPAPH